MYFVTVFLNINIELPCVSSAEMLVSFQFVRKSYGYIAEIAEFFIIVAVDLDDDIVYHTVFRAFDERIIFAFEVVP